MKRSSLINDLVKIYDTRPDGCSSYHIIDMLLYAAEKRGMLPPEIENVKIFAPGGYMSLEEALKRGVREWEPEEEDEAE